MAFNVGIPMVKTAIHPAKRQKHGDGLKKAPKTAYGGAIWNEMCDDRIGRDSDIVPELTKDNVWLRGDRVTANEMLRESYQRIDDDNKNRKEHGLRSQRRDCVDTIAGIFKPPIEVTSSPDFDEDAFYKDAIDCFESLLTDDPNAPKAYRCGELNHAVIHKDEVIGNLKEDEYTSKEIMDEVTGEIFEKRIVLEDKMEQIRERMSPHCHFTFVPWVWETDKETGEKFKTLNAKKFYNSSFLNRVNKKMPELLREKGWDVKDCTIVEEIEDPEERKKAKQKAHGQDAIRYKAEAEHQKIELEKENERLKFDNFVLKEKNEDLEMELELQKGSLRDYEHRNERLKIENEELLQKSEQQHQLINDQAQLLKQQSVQLQEQQRLLDILRKDYKDLLKRAKSLVEAIQPMERLKGILDAIKAFKGDFQDFIEDLFSIGDITKEEKAALKAVEDVIKEDGFDKYISVFDKARDEVNKGIETANPNLDINIPER